MVAVWVALVGVVAHLVVLTEELPRRMQVAVVAGVEKAHHKSLIHTDPPINQKTNHRPAPLMLEGLV